MAFTLSPAPATDIDSRDAWIRLAIALLIQTIGAAGMWSVVVALPPVQAEFGVSRADASLPYTLTLIGFGIGGMLHGRLSDRVGIFVPLVIGSVSLGVGYILAGFAPSLLTFGLAQGLLVGMLGSSSGFGPLIADTSLWFAKRRGIAVAICASGNYLGGAIWPPVMQHFIDTAGWRATHIGMGIFCLVTLLPLSFLLRRRSPAHSAGAPTAAQFGGSDRPAGLSPAALQGLLVIAGFACCVAMSMPQVHIVAYCGDLGYGAARGAEMLALMLGFGIISRLACGVIADRIGGLRTLLASSILQCIALFLFLPFDSLASLYVISALFGLFQGGIVPSYAIIVREYFSPREAGQRVGLVLLATVAGMAVGGWMNGLVFDLAGSYDAAFLNGIAWNAVNIAIAIWILRRPALRRVQAA